MEWSGGGRTEVRQLRLIDRKSIGAGGMGLWMHVRMHAVDSSTYKKQEPWDKNTQTGS